jgi:hypothetical protein
VIATGRNLMELEQMRALGADVVIPFALDAEHPSGVADYEEALAAVFTDSIDVVLDYLWGQSAKIAMVALARTVEERRVRFVHVGSASGEANIDLPGSLLRSAAIDSWEAA